MRLGAELFPHHFLLRAQALRVWEWGSAGSSDPLRGRGRGWGGLKASRWDSPRPAAILSSWSPGEATGSGLPRLDGTVSSHLGELATASGSPAFSALD